MSDQRTESGTELNKVTQSAPLPDLPPMTKNQVMDLAMDMGKILLKSGAETTKAPGAKAVSFACAGVLRIWG